MGNLRRVLSRASTHCARVTSRPLPTVAANGSRRRRICAIVAGAWIAACGAPTKPTTPVEPPVVVKTFTPMGIRDDAKAPNQAAILGTDDKDGSTLIPLAVTTTTTSVDAMVVRLAPDVVGGLTGVKLSTGPNPEHTVQVGTMEQFSEGTGPQWRASVWIAAFVAATALDKDLTDFTFSATTTGHIDGASASGLMAAGFIASITGAKIDPTATLTGIINPDGTLGPVDGIPEKFLAAIEKGKRRLGYPIGTRHARSAKTGDVVDLEKLATDHGAKAVEVADVHDAYALLTGTPLPRAVPVPVADMALEAETAKAIEVKYTAWQQKLATEWAPLLQLESAGRLPQLLTVLRDASKHMAEGATSAHDAGHLGAAYARMFAATEIAQTTNQAYAVLAAVQDGKLDDAVALLARHDHLAEETTTILTQIGSMRPPTMGGHLKMMAAFRAAVRGLVFQSVAQRTIDAAKAAIAGLRGKSSAELGSPAVADAVIEVVVPSLMYVSKTRSDTVLASEQLAFEGEKDVNYMCSLPNVRRLATSFQSAGAAGLTYFEALLVMPMAQQMKLSEDEARERVAYNEPEYLVAYTTSRLDTIQGVPQQLRTTWGEQSLAWGLFTLAGSQLAYYDAAQLIAKYYSLRASATDDTAQPADNADQDRVVTAVLAIAERTARASARAARIATGSIPVQAKLAYQNAIADQDGSLSDKLDALDQFWASSAYSQTAVMLARN